MSASSPLWPGRAGIGGSSRPAGGFTLLEMMIAVSIMAIGLTAVYQLHAQSLTLLSQARFETVAPMLAQQKLAELEGQAAADLVDDEGSFDDIYADYKWQVAISDIESGRLEKVGQNFKQVDITVQAHQGAQTYTMRTFRYFFD